MATAAAARMPITIPATSPSDSLLPMVQVQSCCVVKSDILLTVRARSALLMSIDRRTNDSRSYSTHHFVKFPILFQHCSGRRIDLLATLILMMTTMWRARFEER